MLIYETAFWNKNWKTSGTKKLIPLYNGNNSNPFEFFHSY